MIALRRIPRTAFARFRSPTGPVLSSQFRLPLSRLASTGPEPPSAKAPVEPSKGQNKTEASHADASTSGTAGAAEAPAAPAPRSAFTRAWDSFLDVAYVTLGLERTRDLAAEYASGERPYPWVCFTEAASAKTLYYNRDSGVVTEIKPPDWDRFSTPASYVTPDADSGALQALPAPPSAWDRTVRALGAAPIIEGVLAVGQAVAASPVGVAASAVKTRISDKIEDAREVWETSQHPLIVNASSVVDSVLAESEQGRALRTIHALDPGFDEYVFIEEMQRTYLPALAAAFFKLDMSVLRTLCKDSALAQVRSVAAARAIEGLEHTGAVLQVQRPMVFGARTIDASGADGAGTLPVIVVTCQVQYIHCISNKKGEVVEGAPHEIKVAFFVVAVTREYDAAKGALAWKAVELAMQGAQLYL